MKEPMPSMFLIAAAEEFSRKEIDRRSGEVKLDTKVNGHRCTEDHRESKDHMYLTYFVSWMSGLKVTWDKSSMSLNRSNM